MFVKKTMRRVELIKIAVMSDIHGNLPAFETVLNHAAKKGIDFTVHLGDIIGIGPYTLECMELLADLRNFYAIMGNHDEKYAFGKIYQKGAYFSLEQNAWVDSFLNYEHKAFLKNLPYYIEHEIYGHNLYFTHFARNKNGAFLPARSKANIANLSKLFDCSNNRTFFFGHTHKHILHKDKSTFINPGSVGCDHSLTARYALVTITKSEIQTEFFSLKYAIDVVKRELDSRHSPDRRIIKRAFFTKMGGQQ